MAVELITKEIAQDNHAGRKLSRNFSQCSLVYFEHAKRCAAGSIDEGGGDTRHQVGASAIAADRMVRPNDCRQHCRGRGLTVGSTNRDDAVGQLGCQLAQPTGSKPEKDMTGHRCAATLAGDARGGTRATRKYSSCCHACVHHLRWYPARSAGSNGRPRSEQDERHSKAE